MVPMKDAKDSLSASSATAKKLMTVNPATEEILNEYTIISEEQLNDRVKRSKNVFLEWKNDVDKRTDFLYGFAKELR
jgi:succinate-semialdehyde dehydrogenase/glutarate-semialdehyde dehydrogenase/succinyl-CoA reductase